MRTVKQPKGSRICTLACVATLTGQDLDYLLKVARPNRLGGIDLLEVIRLLAAAGYQYGYKVDLEKAEGVEDVDELPDILDVPLPLTLPLLMSVRSWNHPQGMHSVVWDHKEQQVRDPNPEVGELTPLRAYDVVDIAPIYKVEYYRCPACTVGIGECEGAISACDRAEIDEATLHALSFWPKSRSCECYTPKPTRYDWYEEELTN